MRNTETERETEKWRWESQIEVDNGVHPLHWATSPGPSPMGTDPINGFKKNGTNGSGLCNPISAVWTKVCKTSSLEYHKLAFKSKEKPNKTEKTVDSLQSRELDINSKVFKTSSVKVTQLDFIRQKKPSITENSRLQKEQQNALWSFSSQRKRCTVLPTNRVPQSSPTSSI